MIDFLSLSLADLRTWLLERGYPAFQAEQIFSWVYGKGARSWDGMTNLSAALREALAPAFRLQVLQPCRHRAGDDRVQKFQWQLVDKSYMESVLVPDKGGWHLSASSQVGCPGGCSFCASGKRFVRNLHTSEMVDQALQARRWIVEAGGKDINHIFFDGMGEPLKNMTALLATLEALCDRDKMQFNPKRITVSTVGVIEGIERLLDARIPVNLTVGLHASNQSLRQKVIPYAKRNRIHELLDVCRRYAAQMGVPVTFDYAMLAGFNDHPDKALELSHLVKNIRCQIRLIPYHPVPGLSWQTPGKKEIKAFRSVLFGNKVANTLYEGKGVSIGAALGQLSPKSVTVPEISH